MSFAFALEDRLILACARVDADRGRAAELAALGPDWDALVRKADRWGVVPLVEAHVQALDLAPAEIAKRLRHLRQRETIHGIARGELLQVILAAFTQADVPVIVLKGAALAALVYPSPALRPMRDIDLLVQDDDQGRVNVVMDRVKDTLAGSDAHARNPYLRVEGLRSVDIVRNFYTATGAESPIPIEDLWDRARVATIASERTRVFAPEDLLLHLVFHLTLAARFAGQVRTLCDIAAVCRRYREAIDWTAVCRRSCAYGLGLQTFTALQLARELAGADVPSEVFAYLEDRLRQRPTEADLVEAGRRVVSEKTNSEIEDAAEAHDTKSTPAPPAAASREPAPAATHQTAARGEVIVTHDQGLTDGVGSQLHRIFGFYALARALGLKYVHSGMREVGYQGLMPLLTSTQDPDFTSRYNAFFALPSDAVDLEECDIVRLHSVDEHVIERYQQQAGTTGRPVLIRGHLPYAYINRFPAGYQVLRTVSPYRDQQPAGPVRISIHLRRGDNSVQGRERESPRPLFNDYFVRVCTTVTDALRAMDVPFVVRLHTEIPPRPYTLHPGIPGVYFNLDRPSMIDPADYALEDFDVIPNLEMVLNVEPKACIDDFATADVLILSMSSLGFVGGLLNPHGCVICPEAFHAALPDWLVATREGVVDAGKVAARLHAQLRDRVPSSVEQER